MKRALALVLCAALLVAAEPPGRNASGLDRGRKAYITVETANEKELFVYFGVATALILRANYISPDFFTAMAAERARLMNPSEADHLEYVQRWTDDLAEHHVVVFSADSPVMQQTRFGMGDAGWVLRLEADGVEEPLLRVDRVRVATPVQVSLFPHLNIWSDLWVARFERTIPSPHAVVLHVGSGYGHGEMRWVGVSGR